jgi:site-specific recombinase XerC
MPYFESISTNSPLGKRQYGPPELLYGTGMRCQRMCSLRVEDFDFHNNQVIVMGKGRKNAIFHSRRHSNSATRLF